MAQSYVCECGHKVTDIKLAGKCGMCSRIGAFAINQTIVESDLVAMSSTELMRLRSMAQNVDDAGDPELCQKINALLVNHRPPPFEISTDDEPSNNREFPLF